MALLREVIQCWPRNLRLCSTQVLPYLDPLKLRQKVGRSIPTSIIRNADLLLNKWLSENKPIGPNEWVIARKDLMASTTFGITETTVDMTIVNLCLNSQKIDVALEYLIYIWETKREMNIAAMGCFLKCCFCRRDRQINEVEKKYIYEIYDAIRKKYPVLDSTVGENCIAGISKTERWRESIEVLELIKLSDMPRLVSYSAIISAAFDNNDPEIGWKYLTEVIMRINPTHEVYIKYLEYCKRNFHGMKLENEIGKMFEFWADHDVRPYFEVIDAYVNALEELGWTAVKTSIRKDGVCNNCYHKLSSLRLTDEEYATLAKTIRDRVIVGDDVYRHSNPQEYKDFIKFVEHNKPWDVVIDGLNIAYRGGKSDPSVIYETVKLLVTRGKRVLVLGRNHMAKWRSLNIAYIKTNAHIFLLDNNSADDPYALYATFSSGRTTMLFSGDFMRQHVHRLENTELKRIFKFWQMSNQTYPIVKLVPGRPLDIRLNVPTKYLPIPQKHSNRWHLPFSREVTLSPADIFEPPKSWICFTKN